MELIKYSKAKFEKNNLILNEDLTIDEWKELGQSLKQVEGSVQFWIGDWARFGDKKGFTGRYLNGAVYDELEHITGIDRRTIQDYKTVADRVKSTERHADLGFSHHREVAKLSEEKQIELLTKASNENLSVRELREEIRRSEKLSVSDHNMPDGLFDVIVIDPPWEMEKIKREVAPNQIGFDYPTLSIEEIGSINLPASDDCHLFCWTTHKHLPDTFNIIECWGFKYICLFTWHKSGGFQPWNLPQYNSEFILYCRKGSPVFIDTTAFNTCFEGKRREHSRKPDEFYEVITRVTGGRRVDIFSREKREGWEQFGNEIEKFA